MLQAGILSVFHDLIVLDHGALLVCRMAGKADSFVPVYIRVSSLHPLHVYFTY